MRMIKVESSNLHSIGWAEAGGTLRVVFNSGIAYNYFNVPASVAARVLFAESQGSVFNELVKSDKNISFEKEEV